MNPRNSDKAMVLSRRAMLGVAGAALSAGQAFAEDNSAVDARVYPRPAEPKAKPFTFQVNGPAERVGMSSERLKRIGVFIQDKIDKNIISGAVTAVQRRGELVHYEAYGYLNAATKAQPLPKDTLYRMASSTKPINAVCTMMMLEEGKLRLQDPVSKFIPEFANMKVAVLKPGQPATRAQGAPPRQYDLVPLGRPITILDLATHTSGIQSNGVGSENFPVERGGTTAEYVAKVAKGPSDLQPGTRWVYTTAGGAIMGRITEMLSGMDLDTFMRKRIFEPLGMVDTFYNIPPAKLARFHPQQRFTDGKWVVDPEKPQPTKYFSGSGGLYSTCKDYMLFEQMLLNRGELNGVRLLGARTVELMGSNLIGDLYKGPSGDQPGHGFGVMVRVVVDSSKSDTGRSNGAFGWDGAGGTMSWNDKAEDLTACIMLQQRDVHNTMWGFERVIRAAIID